MARTPGQLEIYLIKKRGTDEYMVSSRLCTFDDISEAAVFRSLPSAEKGARQASRHAEWRKDQIDYDLEIETHIVRP